jgi:hypothetical protein
MAATLQYLAPLPASVRHTLADSALQTLVEVLRTVQSEAACPPPQEASTPAAAHGGTSADPHRRRGKAKQQGRGHHSTRQTSEGPIASTTQQGAAQDRRQQALDTLGLMVGCLSACRRTVRLLSQDGPVHGKMQTACCTPSSIDQLLPVVFTGCVQPSAAQPTDHPHP